MDAAREPARGQLPPPGGRAVCPAPIRLPTGNLGSTLARVPDLRGAPELLERRFVALLAARPQDLPGHLRRAVALAATHGLPINWPQLLADLRSWTSPHRPVQRAWAAEYWPSEPGAH